MGAQAAPDRLLLGLGLLLYNINLRWVHALHTDQCSGALGMKSGNIPDHHITASSYFDAAVNAIYGRANVEMGGGAWCPRAMVYREGKEFLEVNLDTNHVLTKVEVQGRFGNGQGREFAEQFKLQYWRPGLKHWSTYKDGHGNEILEGNSNTYLAVTSTLHPSIVASRVRFLPYSHHPRTVCMRVEIYGCPYSEGLVSYNMEDGDPRGGDDGLRDLTYDGSREDGFLTDGLGQLTDGETGHTNFRVDAIGLSRGYEWVGWRNDSRRGRPVEIVFEFDQIRNFSALHIYTNNFFTKDTQVFSRGSVSFSIGGEQFSSDVEYAYVADRIFDNARNVTIKLPGSPPARFLKLQLYFALRWIMISEVAFDSVPCECNITDEIIPTFTVLPTMEVNGTKDVKLEPVVPTKEDVVPVIGESSGLLLGGLVTLGVVFCVVPITLGILYYRSRNARKSLGKTPLPDGSASEHKVSMKMKDLHMTMNLTPMSNGYSRAKGKLYGHVAMDDETTTTMYQEPYKGSMHNQGYNTLGHSESLIKYPIPPDSLESVDYAVPDLNVTPPPPFSEVYKQMPPPIPLSRPPPSIKAIRKTPTPPMPPIPPPPELQYYVAPKLCQASNIQSTTGAVAYVASKDFDMDYENSLNEIPNNCLRVLEILGEGNFGTVHLCEADGIHGVNEKQLVVVKSLKPGADEKTEKHFQQEMKVLSFIEDANIVQLLGVSNQSLRAAMVLEYCEHGDLYHFLLRHNMEGSGSPRSASTCISSNTTIGTLSYGALVHVATQIASGMKYLEATNLVHRDLAARNCLVGPSLQIKISDFAMSQQIFSNDYYSIGEISTLLPIRWMAWESVLQGRFSTKSDVWAFGVTLWEILTLARRNPYVELRNEGVLENISHCYHGDGSGMIMLPCPPLCPREMYDMMLACWRTNERQRPPFWEITMFLQRKNLGYSLDYFD
ncbi:unnamed protein product [Meganyctiphanes norvegica]|uniref:Discoidin domain receptor n=1 Tax=Meganyctiphanes norvegica TaxID=48144 RepID=A0AAV2R1J7_MEGNR